MFALASAAALEPCRAIPEGEDADSKGKSPSLAAPIRLPGESEGGGGDGKPVSLIVQRIPQGGGDPAPADFVVRRGDPALVALAPALREGEKLLRICADEKWPAGFDLEFTFSAPPAKGASVRHAGAAAALAAWALALDKPAPPPDTAVLGDLNADGGLRLAGRIGSAQWAALAFAKRIIVPPAAEEELVDRYLIGGPEACGAAAIFAADRLGDAARLSQPDPDFEKALAALRGGLRRFPDLETALDHPRVERRIEALAKASPRCLNVAALQKIAGGASISMAGSVEFLEADPRWAGFVRHATAGDFTAAADAGRAAQIASEIRRLRDRIDPAAQPYAEAIAAFAKTIRETGDPLALTGAEAEAAKRRLRDAANQIRAGRREMIAARP